MHSEALTPRSVAVPAVSTVTVDVRYRDIDAMGHVNNAV
jgi:acyl-CoA thioesterase FadM